MPLPQLKKRELHLPATIGDVALHFKISASLVRLYCLTGVCSPATDSRRRRLFIRPDLERIAAYRKVHGRK